MSLFYTLTFICNDNNLLKKSFTIPNNIKQSEYYELEVQSAIIDSADAQEYEIIWLETTLRQPLSYNSLSGTSSKTIAWLLNDEVDVDITATPTKNALTFHRNILNPKTIVSLSPGEVFTASLQRIDGTEYITTKTILRWAFTVTLKPITL